MVSTVRSLIAVLAIAGLSAAAGAQVRLDRYFTDHMVLQRDQPVVVRGVAGVGSHIDVRFGDQHKQATAGPDGRWSVTLDAMAGEAAGRELRAASVDGGGEATIRNVVVGDVFLYARQTAIDVSLGGTEEGRQVAAAYQPAAAFRAMRIRTQAAKQPLDELGEEATDGWASVDQEGALAMSAAAFHLGRDLSKDRGVPVGIIDLNMGVYFAIGWLSDSALQASIVMLPDEKELGGLIDDMRKQAEDRDDGTAQRELDAYYANLVERADGKPVGPKPSLGLHPLENPMYPSGGYNAVIHPLRGIAMRGVVLQLGADYAYIPYRRLAELGLAQTKPELDAAWAQNYMIMKVGYRSTDKTLPHVIDDWRRALGQRDLPIGLVSPPASDLYAYAEHNREMRELHRRMAAEHTGVGLILPAMKNVPFSGQPADERLLADRCLRWVLHAVDDRADVVASGPLFDRVDADLNHATVHFKPGTADGLQATDDALQAFEVAAPGGEFMPATASIDGSTIKLHCDEVGLIQYVRFNWRTHPQPGLVNAAGLPAVPFNTDDRWRFGWYYPEPETDLPVEYSTTADTWGDKDVAIINGEVEYVVTGDAEFTPRRPGPLGIYASPFGPNLFVLSIDPGTPAVGKVMPGDYVFGVNGTKFQGTGDTPYLQLADAITYSESEAGGGKLTLMVRRGKTSMDVTLDLHVLGTYSPTSPDYCPKTRAIIERAKQWSYAQYRPTSGPATNPVGMLGTDLWFLLATGDPEVQGLVRRAVYERMAALDPLKPADPNQPAHNWTIGYDAILFGEYYHATGDRNVLPYLKNLADWAAVTQIKEPGPEPVPWEVAQADEHVGGWRQLYNPTGADRWKSGYGLMPPAGTACLKGIIYAKEAGLEIDEAALQRGVRHCRYQRAEHAYVEYLYWNLRKDAPPTLRPDAEAKGKLSSLNGKLGQAAALFRLLDDHQPVEICSRYCVYAYNNTRYGHGGMFFNNMWTPIGAHAAGEAGFRHFMQGQTWWRDLYRRHDGAFNQVGRGGIGVAYAAHYVAPRQRLRIFGAPRSAFGTRATDYLQPALQAHRERDYARAQALLVELPEHVVIPAEDQPMVDHLLASVRILRESIEHDLSYTEAQIAAGNYDYAAMELAQLRGVVAPDNPRLQGIVEALETPAAKEAMNRLAPQRKQEAQAREAALQADLPPKRKETWVCLTPDLNEKKAQAATTWKMKLVEDRVQAPEGWDDPGFDTTGWDDAAMPISWAMYHTVLFRGTFNIEDKSRFDKVRFRGGFFQQGNVLIYINGELVAKVDNIGRGLGVQDIPLTDYAYTLLKEGENTVAVTTRHKRRWGALRGTYTTAEGFTFMLDARIKE